MPATPVGDVGGLIVGEGIGGADNEVGVRARFEGLSPIGIAQGQVILPGGLV